MRKMIKTLIRKISRLIWIVAGILTALITLRVFLKLIAANPENPFANFIYSLTDLLLWPFVGLADPLPIGDLELEVSSIIAIFVYGLCARIIVSLLKLLIE